MHDKPCLLVCAEPSLANPTHHVLIDVRDGPTQKTVLRSLYALEGNPARPNARSFTILLAGIGKAPGGLAATTTSSSSSSSKGTVGGMALCVSLYREAEAQGVECNGIMAHALLRAFGGDASGALAFFKKELRARLKALDKQRQGQRRQEQGQEEEDDEDENVDGVGVGGGNTHLSLAYLALLHVCGLAGRADLALQSVYIMQRDGLRADRRAWEAYASGKDAAAPAASAPLAAASEAAPSLLAAPYESLLRAETLGTLGWEGGEVFSFKRIRIRF